MQEVPRPYFSRALKYEAIRRVTLEGKRPACVARELALSETIVNRWVDAKQAAEAQLQAESAAPAAPGDDARLD